MRIRPENFVGLLGASPDVVYLDNWPVADRYKIAGGWIYAEERGEFPGGKRRNLEYPGLFLSFAQLGAHGEPSDSSISDWVSENGLLRAREDGYFRPAPMTVEDFRTEVLCAHQLLRLYTNMRTDNTGALWDMIVKAKRHPSSEWPNTPLTVVDKDIRGFIRSHPEWADLRSEEEVLEEIEALKEVAIEKFLPSYEGEFWEWMRKEKGEEAIEWDRRIWTQVYSDPLFREEIIEADERYLERRREAVANGWLLPPKEDEDWRDEDIIDFAWISFEQALGECVRNVRPGFGERRNPKLRRTTDYVPPRSWECPDLLSAIYLQFYLFVTSDKPARYCENPACGMPLLVTRKNKRFCNASCRSNARHYRKP